VNPGSENEGDPKAPAKNEGKNVRNWFSRKRIMDFAIRGVVTISIVLWILTTVFAYNKQETALIWSCYFAIALTILAFFLNLQKRAWEKMPQTKTTERTEDRPWLNVEVSPAGPITYRPQQSGLCAFIPIKYRVTNAGRSPSNQIQLKADVFFRRFKVDPKDQQRALCNWEGNPFRPGVVFPSTPEEYTITYVIPISRMKEAGATQPHLTAEQVKHFDAYVGGCITYKWDTNPTSIGETGFLYEITIPSPKSGGCITPEIGEDIPLERLAFRRYFFGGGEWAT
jgi:hypothetical protein